MLMGFLQVSNLCSSPSWCVKAGPYLQRDKEHLETFPAAPVCFASCRDMPECFSCRGKDPLAGVRGVAMSAEIGPASGCVSPALWLLLAVGSAA